MSAKSPAELEEIQEWECLEILARRDLGRIAIVVEGQPQIFPVNYAMSGEQARATGGVPRILLSGLRRHRRLRDSVPDIEVLTRGIDSGIAELIAYARQRRRTVRLPSALKPEVSRNGESQRATRGRMRRHAVL